MFKYSFALIIAMLLLSMPVYAHDTLNIQNGNQVHGDGDKENCHYHYYTTDDGHIAWEQSVIDTWIPDAQDDIDGGTYVDEELPDIIIPENDDGDAPRPVSLNPSPVTENIIHNHSVACNNGYRLTNHGGDGGWHSHAGIIRGTAGNGIVYTPEYLRLHNEKTPCIETPAPILPTPILSAPIAKSVDHSVESTPVAVSTPRRTPVAIAPVVLPTNVLRITYLSFAEVQGRSRVNSDMVLTLRLTAYSPDTQHNFLVIRVNGYDYPTPNAFFGTSPLNANDMREVSLASRPRNSAVYLKVKTPKNGHWINGAQRSWQVIERFDISNFAVSIRDIDSEIDRDAVTQDDFDGDGNRIGSVLGAPSSHRMLTGLWADLKKK